MKRKKLLTLILSLFLACGVICGTLAFEPKAKAEDSNPEWLSSFTMLAGAEVRTADPNGIRFTTEISATEYNALMAKVESGEYQAVEFGTLICPMEFAENGAITSESNANVTKIVRESWDVEYNPTLQTDVYQYNGDLIGLTDADLVREYQALGYCTITSADGNAVTYYATVENEGDNVRSPLYVAAYNVVNYENNDDYLLSMIDVAMEGKTLTLSKTSANLNWKQEIDFPLVATVDGVEVSVVYYVEDESIASYENGKLTALQAGSTNIVAALIGAEGVYTAKVPVTVSVDTSRFDGLEAKTITEQDGQKSASSTLVYEKGVGLWFKVEVNHDVFTKGWGGSGLDIDVTINGTEYWLYYGTNGVGAVSTGNDGVGFDLSESTIVVTENAEGSATKYSTLIVALISEQTLLADGVSQDLINQGTIFLTWVAVKSPGEDSITGTSSGMWLIHGEAYVGVEGYFVPVPEIDVSRFEGLEAKTATAQDGVVNLSAVMVYEKGKGLWVKVEATHDVFTKGWGGSGVNLEVMIGAAQFFIYYGTSGVGYIDFDAEESAMRVTENEGEGANYLTLVVGLITDAKLLASGLTQEQLDKEEIPVVHAAFGSPNEGWWYIHKDVYVGEEGYFVPVPEIDVSRFDGLEAKTVTEKNGTRSLSAVMVYEKGVGLWVKVEATHNVFTQGWGGSGLDLEVKVGTGTYFIYYGTSGVGVIDFDKEASAMRVTENKGEGAKYSTLVVGLITNEKLLANGVTQAELDSASIPVVHAAFKSPGEGSFVTTEETTTSNDYWYIHREAFVGEEGYFVPVPEVDVSRFEGLEAKSIVEQDGTRSFAITMVYEKGEGLWIKVDAQHNSFVKSSWVGDAMHVELFIANASYFLYHDNNGVNCYPASTDFDLEQSHFVVTENKVDGAKFTTLMVGLLKEETLLAGGVSEELINNGNVLITWVALKVPGEGSFTTTAGSSSGDSRYVLHGEANVGEEGYFVPAPVVVDPFEGLPTASLVANDGSRVLTSSMCYEKGVGLWVKVDAMHNKFAKGWAGSGLDLDITVEGVQILLYYGTNGPASCFGSGVAGGFDMNQTTFEVTEDSGKYKTAIVGLIPSQVLLDMGVSQATLDRGYLKVTTAFKSPGEGSFVDVYGYSTPADWWYIHRELLVSANGYLIGGEKVKTMSFADSTTKKAFNFSATLTEFGLYVHAEVKADAIGDGLIALAYYTNYWSPSNGGVAQLYLGKDGGQAPTWKRVTHFTGINAETYGYSNYLVFEALYDWTFLGNLGLMSYDSANKMESTIYLSPSFCSGESMSFNVAEGDGTIKQISSTEWRFGGSQWTAIDSGTVKYITLHITKNGIAN